MLDTAEEKGDIWLCCALSGTRAARRREVAGPANIFAATSKGQTNKRPAGGWTATWPSGGTPSPGSSAHSTLPLLQLVSAPAKGGSPPSRCRSLLPPPGPALPCPLRANCSVKAPLRPVQEPRPVMHGSVSEDTAPPARLPAGPALLTSACPAPRAPVPRVARPACLSGLRAKGRKVTLFPSPPPGVLSLALPQLRRALRRTPYGILGTVSINLLRAKRP
jgi:hypothetical protein